MEDKIHSIKILFTHITTIQEIEALHAVINYLVQEALDLNTIHENPTLRTQEQLNVNEDRLIKFTQWGSKTTDSIIAWTRKELTRLCIKYNVIPTAQLKTSLQDNVHELQSLLEPTTILQTTAREGSIGYIQRFNKLI